jgi:hypothetical protein
MRLRSIDDHLPRQVIENAANRYWDNETGYMIAVAEVYLYNRLREVMVAFSVENDTLTVITIHPLKEGQRENRIRSGRWRKMHEGF